MRPSRFIPFAALLLMALAPEAAPQGSPDAPPQLAPGKATPEKAPYDTTADAHAQVAAAFATARTTGRKVLLDFGGNWCPDCRMLAGVLDVPQVHDWAGQHFTTVLIDVGRENKNLDIAAKYGVKITAVPTVLVITPDGKLLNGDAPFALADARSWSQQAVVDLLAKWEKI
jgi:thiol-disulfide isomerase/thioredoxin